MKKRTEASRSVFPPKAEMKILRNLRALELKLGRHVCGYDLIRDLGTDANSSIFTYLYRLRDRGLLRRTRTLEEPRKVFYQITLLGDAVMEADRLIQAARAKDRGWTP